MSKRRNDFADERTEIPRRRELLLVPENAAEASLMLNAVESEGTSPHLNVVESGSAAMEYLRRGKRTPAPSAIIVSSSGLKPDDVQLLQRIKEDEELRRIPVIILSSASDEAQVQLAYRLKANAFVPKPSSTEEFLNCLRSVLTFWVEVAHSPPPASRRAATV